MKKLKTILVLASVAATQSACSKFETKMNSDNVNDSLQCQARDLSLSYWDDLKSFVKANSRLPTDEEISLSVDELSAEPSVKKSLKHNFLKQKQIVERVAEEEKANSKNLIPLVTALDVGDQSTDPRAKVRGELASLEQSNQKIQKMQISTLASENCSSGGSSEPVGGGNDDGSHVVGSGYDKLKAEALQSGTTLAAFGGRWSMSTAYQSCNTVKRRPLSVDDADLQGISIVGTHPDGVGSRRAISDLPKLQATHPYLESSYPSQCVSVKSNPLIYDYGGKPASGTTLNFFKQGGDGQSTLGIDCSGYVFTAFAAVGLKMKSGRPLKASDVEGWGSSSYLNPESNGMTCLQRISLGTQGSLKNGDVVAVSGHVVLIDRVGSDPFGISKTSKAEDCSKINADYFDFVIAQSSPSKNGVGLNYFIAKDYLPTSLKMNTGLVKYAQAACSNYYAGKTTTPNISGMSIVRHKGTSDCVATRVALVGEQCVESCSSMLP